MLELVNAAESVGRGMAEAVQRGGLESVTRYVVTDVATGSEYRLRPWGGYMTQGVEYVPVMWALVAFEDDHGDDDEVWQDAPPVARPVLAAMAA